MHKVERTQKLPYAAEQVYALVADIENYPAFLPWCQQVRILRKNGDYCDARVVVGFKGIRQSYHCRVHSLPQQHEISVEYLSGPLADLFTRWVFTDDPDANAKGCVVDFRLEFAMRNRLLAGVMDRLMLGAVEKMTDAFVHRAHSLYGIA